MQTEVNGELCRGCETMLTDWIVSEGYIVCTLCGTVSDIYVDTHAEWRCFKDDVMDLSAVRCGASGDGSNLSTFIGGNDKKMQRVHHWNTMSAKDKNISDLLVEYRALSIKYGLSKVVINTAIHLYSTLYTLMENTTHGVKRCNVRLGLKAACLFYACKQVGQPRDRREIAKICGYPVKVVSKGCNLFLDMMAPEFFKMSPFKPSDFVPRFCQILGINGSLQDELLSALNDVTATGILSEHTPISISCGSLYWLSVSKKLGITKDQIHLNCGSSPLIIKKVADIITKYFQRNLS